MKPYYSVQILGGISWIISEIVNNNTSAQVISIIFILNSIYNFIAELITEAELLNHLNLRSTANIESKSKQKVMVPKK